MSKKTLIFILLLSVVAILLGLNYFFTPFADLSRFMGQEPEPEVEEVIKIEEEPLTNSQKVLQRMSAEQKIGQILAWPVIVDDELIESDSVDLKAENDQSEKFATTSAEEASESAQIRTIIPPQEKKFNFVNQYQPGFVTLFGENISTKSAQIVTEEIRFNNASAVRPFVAVDHEGGSVQRLSGEGFTVWDSWQKMCSQESEELAEVFENSAQELKTAGIDIVYGPVVDVAQSNPVLKGRVCSDDPNVITDKTTQLLSALSKNGILGVIKHFPGIGLTRKDLHNDFESVEVTAEDAFVYRKLLSLFPQIGVMVTHVGVEQQFPDVPCSLSESCVGELSDNFNDILIFSDALEMESAAFIPEASQTAELQEKPLTEVSREAVLAGNNVLVFGQGVDSEQLVEIRDMLVYEYKNNSDFAAKVDASAEKIIGFKLGQN